MQKDLLKKKPSSAQSNLAVAAYITIIGLIISYVINVRKRNLLVSFHIQQSLGLTLVGVLLGFVSLIPVIGWILYILGFIVLLYMWIVGLMHAINHKFQSVPFLGENFTDWFKNI